MDIPRPELGRRKRLKTAIYSTAAGVVVIAATVVLGRLEPAAPSVPRASVVIDSVRQGEMLRRVRGPGNLVPREIRWIAAQTAGRVDRILVRPGAAVEADTVLVEMTNTDLMQQMDEARFALEGAEAELVDTDLRLKSQLLDMRAAAGLAHAEYEGARLKTEAERTLFAEGIVSEIDFRVSELSVEQLKLKMNIEDERLEQFSETMDAQLTGARTRVSQARTVFERRRDQVDSLEVRAGADGVLQEVQVEEGQQVVLGANIARVARPDDLKAELKISETQARDVQIGQRVDVDTRNGIVEGHVTRVDPAVQNGSVQVDVEFKGNLPRGARPDLSVDGTIEIERLDDVMYMGRPVYVQADSTVGLFRLEADGEHAVRVPVQVGRTSVSEVEIVQGLAVGDQVILSDTSSFGDYERIRLN
jgi:HlyD family secretion protein